MVGLARIMEQPSINARVHGVTPEKTAFVSNFTIVSKHVEAITCVCTVIVI